MGVANSKEPAPTFLTTSEVASMLRTSPSTLADWTYRQVGPPSVKIGRRRLYALDDVLRWVQEQREAQRQEQPETEQSGQARRRR